ncbi:scoloptoxin SSD14 isoform X2 [Teleopsis dalmanni]|nr:scoloptoxin SSD14 isoform X2 [Teleopsis dalmanni]
MVHSNDDAMNKIPLKSSSGLDDEEKNGGEFVHDTTAAEEARREQMRANILKWVKKLTIVLICFIGIALISYVIISLCFSDWSKSTNSASPTTSTNTSLLPDDTNNIVSSKSSGSSQKNDSTITDEDSTSREVDANNNNVTYVASFDSSGKHVMETTTKTTTTVTQTTSATVKDSSTKAASLAPTTVETIEEPKTGKSTSKVKADLLHDTPITDTKFESKLGVFEQAAVCSDKEVCSQVGSHILEEGGSAVDAAIATMLCNGVVTMHSMGIGGGMLMNIYIKEQKHAFSIDAREVAPFSAVQDMFDNNSNLSLHGGLAIAVPGELMGYHRAHERFGKLTWKQLIEPSIKICNEGFYLSKHQWNAFQYKRKHLLNNTVITNVFLNETTGELHPIGTKLKPPKELCSTYELLAENGPLDFYNGTLAKLVAEDLKDLGSPITLYDLETYVADLVSSITMQLGNDTLYSVPPISSGSVVANVLSILENFNFTKADLADVKDEALTIHRIVEALKFGFAKRWELGDLRFNDVRELVSKLTTPEYNTALSAQINDSSVLNSIYEYGAQYLGVDDVGTSQAVILAPNGDAVSITSSVNDYFGAGQAGKRTGIIFNSCMNDFSIPNTSNYFGLPAAPSNYIDARKRPMSSMSPMILTDPAGDIRMVFGAAGGSKIISAVVEVAARVLWFDQNIKEAIDAPRFHHQLMPNILEYENEGFSEETLKLLRDKGHQVKPYKYIGSVVCGIVRNSTAVYANADYRKQGGVAGY